METTKPETPQVHTPDIKQLSVILCSGTIYYTYNDGLEKSLKRHFHNTEL